MYYVGFDISKEKLDLSVLNEERTVIESKVIENKPARISKWFDQLLRKLKCSSEEVLVCCENTGIYGEPLVSTCVAKGIPIWVENAYKIKKASHDLRGKSDAQDAQRIADYALRYADRATLHTPPSLETKKLSELIALRDDLLKHKNQAENRIREAKAMDPVRYKIINGCFKRMIKGVEKELKLVEQQINELTKEDEAINKNVELICSIPGVGKRNALMMIAVTHNFTRFQTANHLACYAGVVPFPNQSGKMLRRDRVSPHANRNLKRLLHLAALAMIRCDVEMNQYFNRKVAEGKHKMAVINAVRNKIIHRMFAVIDRQSPYEKMFQNSLQVT
jgi:transposase